MSVTIILNKKSSTGKPLVWEGKTLGNKIIVTHGQVGGKLQTKETVISTGKNIGKSNETAPEQQALIELESTARSKVENDYEVVNGYKFTTVNEKQIKVQNKDIPSPMLAHPIEKHIKKIEGRRIAIQPKLDGFRCVAPLGENKLYSRSRKELIGCPEILKELNLLATKVKDFGVLDGELYTSELTFETISSVVSPRKTLAPIDLREKIEYHIFDYVDTNLSFTDRNDKIQKLNDVITKLELKTLKIVETRFVEVSTLEESLKPIVLTYIEQGYEGIMLRIPESNYECKRSHGIFKYKLFEDCEARCIGFKSEENNTTLLGSIKFELPDGSQFDARPAMTDEERAEIFSNQNVYLGKIGVVKYQEKSEYGIPRFPVFTGKWRESWDMSEG